MTSFSLLALVPAALLWTAQAAATTFPATVEVDLVFPRNDTYAPVPLFPIVFAFQNPELAQSIDPAFDLQLWNAEYLNATSYGPSLDVRWTNFSGSGPVYVWTYISQMNTTDGDAPVPYLLNWDFGAGNCSDNGGALSIGGGFRDNVIQFTLQRGAKSPDLVAASASPSCSDMSHLAFNLTGTLDATGAKYYGRNSCAVFSDVQPLVPGNPCGAQVGTAVASSISAAMTSSNCAGVKPVVSCPSTNAAWGNRGMAYTAYTAVLGGLTAAFLAM
ncbi:hypothetical protein CONLIGDRAFT_630705 [Coniochaeta ligniaria NRRL 30616]|uniref:DUF7136 domain-containing protein n=1 Tax=Coniochaeta ligniaria NRRL 30616 TaxID=1408157 RepID=A0A1J7ITE6_9PEZI|nr:hypothetical protein CONLIGDRAFT_630705 [Coniochaeta ligniaria NRRL 30616]